MQKSNRVILSADCTIQRKKYYLKVQSAKENGIFFKMERISNLLT